MDWKKWGRRLLFPPIPLMILLVILSAAGLVAVFANAWETAVIAYIVYGLSFYTLSVVTVFCILVLPKQYGKIKQKVLANPFGNRYLTDRAYRLKVSLYLSLGINLAYVALQLLQWRLFMSWWFVVLAGYYATLSVMRFLLVRYFRKHAIGADVADEWRRSRICAAILLLVNLSLSGAVLMILYRGRGYDYPGILIYVMAMYTFYSTIHAIVDIVKYRALGSPIMSTAKIVSLSAALVSMLNLETAMFAEFGKDMALSDQRLMIILTGAGISITVITLSVLLIVRATQALKET